MRTRALLSAAASALLLGAACGGSNSPSGSTGGGAGSTSGEITTYQQLAGNTQSAVTSYRATMMASTTTVANCKSIHDQYDAQVRPWISQMVQMGHGMDDFIDGHGGSAYADMRCASATMLNELDYHRTVACTFPGLAADQAEASRHAVAMNSYAGHAWNRCGEMLGSGQGGSCCNWGPMMDGCANWSNTCCSSMMQWGCCGGMMGHGMMKGAGCCDGDGNWTER